jgi:Skp family chaperone for outer membrane proteins
MPRFVPVSLILLSFLAIARAEPTIAVVDFKKVLASHPKAKELETELRATQENAKKVFEAKQKDLKDLDENLQKAAATLKTKDGNTQENIDLARDLQARGREIQQSMLDVQARTRQTIADRQDAVLPGLADEIRKYVATANNGQYAIVLDLSAISRDGLPQIIEAPGAFDLTDRVIAMLPVK